MVDPWVLSSDVVSQVGAAILTPLLWIGLFLWAWSRPAQARASGFGRMTFWLLLPGAFLSSFADAPFFPWAGNVLAINIGGALIPVLLSVVLLRREFGAGSWTITGLVLMLLAVETAVQFVLVVLIPAKWNILLVMATAGGVAAFASVAFSMSASRRPTDPLGVQKSGGLYSRLLRAIRHGLSTLRSPFQTSRPIALRAVSVVGLASTAITLTFATSTAVPGFGIESAFPLYLIGPVVVGVAGVLLAATVWGTTPFQGLSVGYATATLGTLIGADVLREPPLYGGGAAALLAIGGAGIQDLVYFSGLLAVGAGLLVIALGYRASLRRLAALTSPPAPSPEHELQMAADRLGSGDLPGAVRSGLIASQAAAERARVAWQIPSPADPSLAWDGLPVSPYVKTDYRNFVAASAQPAPSLREASRQLAMAAQFVRLGRDLRRLRFASLGRRAWAMVVDLTVVTTPAVLLWTALAYGLPGSPTKILGGLPFNLALFAYVAYALLYFVVSDALFGATPGKILCRLRVTDRNLARPTFLQSLLRESPKAIPLFIIGELGAPAILLLARASGSSVNPLGAGLILFTGALLLGLVGVIVLAALSVGAVQVARNAERQRLGDRWASTWVVDRRIVTPAWGARLARPPAPPGPAPPG